MWGGGDKWNSPVPPSPPWSSTHLAACTRNTEKCFNNSLDYTKETKHLDINTEERPREPSIVLQC